MDAERDTLKAMADLRATMYDHLREWLQPHGALTDEGVSELATHLVAERGWRL